MLTNWNDAVGFDITIGFHQASRHTNGEREQTGKTKDQRKINWKNVEETNRASRKQIDNVEWNYGWSSTLSTMKISCSNERVRIRIRKKSKESIATP